MDYYDLKNMIVNCNKVLGIKCPFCKSSKRCREWLLFQKIEEERLNQKQGEIKENE